MSLVSFEIKRIELPFRKHLLRVTFDYECQYSNQFVTFGKICAKSVICWLKASKTKK